MNATHFHIGIVDIDPVVGKTIAFVQNQANRQEIAITQGFAGLADGVRKFRFELRDKLPAAGAAAVEASVPQVTPMEEDVISALINLGYQRAAAEKALQSVARAGKSPENFEAVFRETLAVLVR